MEVLSTCSNYLSMGLLDSWGFAFDLKTRDWLGQRASFDLDYQTVLVVGLACFPRIMILLDFQMHLELKLLVVRIVLGFGMVGQIMIRLGVE